MTQPTISELRAMATACVEDYPPSEVVRAVAAAFLRYTDDRPLTDGDCHAAEMEQFNGSKVWIRGAVHRTVLDSIDAPATVGLLNLALDLERELAAK